MSTPNIKGQEINKLMEQKGLTPRPADYFRDKAKPSHWIAKISGVFGCALIASAYPSYENLENGLVGSMALAGAIFIAVGVASWRNSQTIKRCGLTADAKTALICLKHADSNVLSYYMECMQKTVNRQSLLDADIANIEELSAMVTLQSELENLVPSPITDAPEPA